MKRIIIIAGPSGAGKTTVTHYLKDKFNIPRVITHTTRPMRKGEVKDESYYFENDESFAKLHFFEKVKYDKNQYGSSHEALMRAWKKNDIVSLIVETKGAESYIDQLGDQVYFIYLTVSNLDILRKRLLERGDSEAEVEKRMHSKEFLRDLTIPADLKPYAHVLINDDWDETKQKLKKIVTELQ